MIDLCLLGTGGMLPLPDRWLSSVIVRAGGELLLLDCGEGTQISLRSVGWGFKALGTICISHFHGDHVSGLPGILLMLANAERRAPVDIYGPAGLAEVVRGLRVVAPHLPFALRLHELAGGETFAAVGLQGRVLAVDHALPCLAYRFDRPRAPRFDPERARALGVPVELWKALQRGAPVRWADRLIEPSAVLGPPRPGLAFAFVTDTRPTPALPDFLRGVDLLVCEGTYGDDADQPKAVEKKHLTFREAATLARAAGVGQLLLTHFSPALRDPEAYAENARAVFPNTLIGRDHLTLTLRFRDDAPDQA